MFWSDLQSLISRLIEWLKRLFKKEERPPQPEYTREDFIAAVKELSQSPTWRARILKYALLKLREKFADTEGVWIPREQITRQIMHRLNACGIIYSFGYGVYAYPKEVWRRVIELLQQDSIKWVAEFSDCDNHATFFRGFADFVLGKPSVVYSTGLVFRTQIQYGRKVCVCSSDYLVGGHGWNKVVTTEPITYELVGTTQKVTDPFTVYEYEPQSDELSKDGFFSNGWCYAVGGGLPIFYGRK